MRRWPGFQRCVAAAGVCLATVWATGSGRAATETLSADRDGPILVSAASGGYWDDNLGANVRLQAGTAGGSGFDNETRSLISFDATPTAQLSGSVTGITLRLFHESGGISDIAGETPFTLEVHAVAAANADWVEGTAASQADVDDGFTWDNRDQSSAGTAWAGSGGLRTAGTDYNVTVLASNTYTVLPAANVPLDFVFTGTPAELDNLVKGWLTTNPGLVLFHGDPASLGLNKRILFHSREETTSGTGAYAPQLIISYEAGAAGIETRPPTHVTATGASLNGYLSGTGTSATAAFVYWGEADGDTNATQWAQTNTFAAPQGTGPLTTNVTLQQGKEFFYRYAASNDARLVWADASEYLLTARITAGVSPATVGESSDSATFTFTRPPSVTSGAVTVTYSIGGDAVNGSDYVLLTGSNVTIAAGATNATVQITTSADVYVEGDEELELTVLGGGGYVPGAPSNAVLTITNEILAAANATTGTGNWHDPGTWSAGFVPVRGQSVTMTNNVIVSNNTARLGSFVIADATLTFTNWNTALLSDTVTIQSGGVLTHVHCKTNPVTSNTNRVYIVCSDLTVDANGSIQGNGRGFPGPVSAPLNRDYYGQGPGRGYGSGGAGHGGRGAQGGYGGVNGGPTYGSSNAPVHPGSGGGGHNTQIGGAGGGAVRIDATGTVTVNGSVTVNGNPHGGQAGAGSGGSLWIDCSTFQGSGTISAIGGLGSSSSAYTGHAGGGGRICIIYGSIDSFSGTRSVAAGYDAPIAVSVLAADGTLVTKYTGSDTLFTVVGSPVEYGTPTPYDYGYRPLPVGTVVTNEIELHIAGPTGTRRKCIGWEATTNGVGIDGGSTTQAVFTLPAEATLQTWHWTNQYALTVSAEVGGTASTEKSGWYTNGELVQVSASATGTFTFSQWTGDLPTEDRFDMPLTLTMDQARTVSAAFANTVAQTKVWHGTGAWSSSTNWTPAGAPSFRDQVIIGSGAVSYDVPFNATGLTISNGANMTVSGWDSLVTVAGNVDIGGTLRHTLTDETTDPSNTNRLVVFCTNLLIRAGGSIDVNERGYRGGISPGNGTHTWGQGPGAGYNAYGGSYGGKGGLGRYGGSSLGTYGSETAPSQPGSGGGCHNANNGGSGGGSVWIEATHTVTLNGTITANGQNRIGQASGGSGGGIYVSCHVFAATNGLVSADGGGYGTGTYDGGAGGGGRIAVHYDTAAQAVANLTAKPSITFSARSGWGGGGRGDPGTIYLPDPGFYPGEASSLPGGQLVIPGLTSFAPTTATFSDGLVILPTDCSLVTPGALTTTGDGGVQVRGTFDVGGHANFNANAFGISRIYASAGSAATVTGNLNVTTGPLYLYSSGTNLMEITVGGDCALTSGGDLYITGGIAPGYPETHGALLDVAGTLSVGNTCKLLPYSHTTNGASPHILAGTVTVAEGGSIDADAKGFAGGPQSGTTWGYGPGGSYDSHGASYAGLGGLGGVRGNRGRDLRFRGSPA